MPGVSTPTRVDSDFLDDICDKTLRSLNPLRTTPLARIIRKPEVEVNARVSRSWKHTTSRAAYEKSKPTPDAVSVPAPYA